MPTYQEVLNQISELQKHAEDLRRQELAAVIKEVKAKIAEYGLSAADLGLTGKQSGKTTKPVAAKYRNQATGETWTGRGRMPKWLVEAESCGRKKEDFLI